MYRATVREGVEVEWRCEFCQHPDADINMEDVGNVFLTDPPPAETYLEDSAVAPGLLSQQPHETTYHLVQEGTIRGKTKLVTNTEYTFNIRKKRPNGTTDSALCAEKTTGAKLRFFGERVRSSQECMTTTNPARVKQVNNLNCSSRALTKVCFK